MELEAQNFQQWDFGQGVHENVDADHKAPTEEQKEFKVAQVKLHA